jgi:hypothetical protein
MSAPVSKHAAGLVLAIHPTSRGFGWVLFESARKPVDWGIASAKAGRNAKLVSRFRRLLRRYDPAVFALETYEGASSRRTGRIRDLCRELQHLASVKGLYTPIYDRELVCARFARDGATTRYAIAQVIAERIPDFDHRMPRYRKVWLAEDARQSLFDAAALALTYYALMGED